MTTTTAAKTRKTTGRTPAKTGNPQADREANAAALRAANTRGDQTAAAQAEAALLNGVRSEDKPGPAKAAPRASKAAAKAKADSKAASKPAAKAEPKPKVEKTPKTPREKALRPASTTVSNYVAWLKTLLGKDEWAALATDPTRLAEVSLQNYGAWQAAKRS